MYLKEMARNLVSSMKMKTLFILLTCFSLTANAQSIKVGDYFNNLGTLRNASEEWQTNEFPLKLVIMYNNGKTTINGNAMNFLIEPAVGVDFPAEDVKLVIGQGRSWAAMKHDFKAPGKYTITAFDREKNALATGIIKIEGPRKVEPPKPVEKPVVAEKAPVEVKEAPEKIEIKKVVLTKEEILENASEPVFVENKIKEELTEEEKETLVFESFYIAFGRGVESGMLQGQNEKFKAVPGGVNAEVLFSNNEGFGTEFIAVDIWFKPKGGTQYDSHYQEMTVTIAKNAKQANFKLNLKDRGSYKVSLYTGDEDAVWIGSGYVNTY
ncbi:MAG: hypothetical protein ACI9UR_000292 [Bacteroidia bacterium]|jgi:hypothetical protein